MSAYENGYQLDDFNYDVDRSNDIYSCFQADV